MRNIISRPLLLPFLVAATACATTPDPTDPGTGSGSDPSGLPTAIGEPSTQPTSGPVAAECDYTEMDDANNDYLGSTNYVLEDSGITFDTTVQRTICGKINTGHFDDWWYSVDVDNYAVTMQQAGDVIVTLTGAAQAVSSVGIYAYNADRGESEAGSYFVGDHGVFAAHLPAGHYEFSVEAYDDHDAAADISYKIHINQDLPVQRCGRITAPATYSETSDGVTSTGNDVVAIDWDSYPSKGMSSGVAEVSSMTMMGGSKYRITGVSDQLGADGSYYDRDTYSITTGPTTNQLSVRLNWVGQTADMDYFLFPQDSTYEIGSAAHNKLGEDEFGTFPVQPSTTYWLWVGASATDASSTWAPYDASICADTFTAQ